VLPLIAFASPNTKSPDVPGEGHIGGFGGVRKRLLNPEHPIPDNRMTPLRRDHMIRSLAVALIALAFTAPAHACMRNHTPAKLVLIDEALEKAKLSAAKAAEVRDLRSKASTLSMDRKYHDAGIVADSALRILKVKWQEPPVTGPIPRC
jgi:hypothetical protein